MPFWVVAQETLLPQPMTQAQPQPLGPKWTASVTLPDWQVFGPATDIKQKMDARGWASSTSYGCVLIFCGGPADYPAIRRYASFDIEAGYRQTKHHGYQLSFGSPQNAEIRGRKPDGNYLNLRSRVFYTSIRWAWYSRNGRFVNSVGPALLLFQDYELRGQSGQHSQMRPGLHVSSQFRFFDRRTWLLAIKTDIRAGLPAATQDYEKEAYVYSTTPTTVTTLKFSKIDLSLIQLNVGLQFGLKIL